MPRYLFTGLSLEVFPTIVTADGTLECLPGDVVDLAGEVDHPRLELVDNAHFPVGDLLAATLADTGDADPAPAAPPTDPPPADPPTTDPPPADAPADTTTSEV